MGTDGDWGIMGVGSVGVEELLVFTTAPDSRINAQTASHHVIYFNLQRKNRISLFAPYFCMH